MPKLVHLVRHGQGFHNLLPEEFHARLPDPPLTENGRQACLDFQKTFVGYDEIELVCASPMRRTLQTALLAFAPVLDGARSLRVVAVPDAQEAFDDPANTGSDVDSIKADFSSEPVDFRLVAKHWERHSNANAVNPHALMERAKRLRAWLASRTESDIVVVGHGNFLHYITGDVDEQGNQLGGWWANLEWRSYELDDERAPRLRETASSAQRRQTQTSS